MSGSAVLAGRIAVALALFDVLYLTTLWAVPDSMGPFAPLIPPYNFAYWALAIAAAGCAVMALRGRLWLWGIAPFAIIAVTLIPSGMLFYECSRGNCF